MTSFLEQVSAGMLAVSEAIDQETAAFARWSGLRCPSGCGQCCRTPNIEAQVAEMLPAARALLDAGVAEDYHERATISPTGACVFYQSHADDPELGRCSHYHLRPGICRLFGFAAVSGKGQKQNLAACRRLKDEMPDTVKLAQRAIDAGAQVPSFSEFSLRISMLAPQGGAAERLPINQALSLAIEKIALTPRKIV